MPIYQPPLDSGVGLHVGAWRRVIIEKPFGHDLASAKELDSVVSEVFDPSSVFRIDHYLGIPARRTHQFELESVRKNTFPYRCRCQQHQLTVRRHNRVVRGEATYRCVHCGEPLVAEM